MNQFVDTCVRARMQICKRQCLKVVEWILKMCMRKSLRAVVQTLKHACFNASDTCTSRNTCPSIIHLTPIIIEPISMPLLPWFFFEDSSNNCLLFSHHGTSPSSSPLSSALSLSSTPAPAANSSPLVPVAPGVPAPSGVVLPLNELPLDRRLSREERLFPVLFPAVYKTRASCVVTHTCSAAIALRCCA